MFLFVNHILLQILYLSYFKVVKYIFEYLNPWLLALLWPGKHT